MGILQTISQDTGDRPKPLVLYKKPSSLNVLCHFHICTAVGASRRILLQLHAVQPCPTVLERTQHWHAFCIQVKAISIPEKKNEWNIAFKKVLLFLQRLLKFEIIAKQLVPVIKLRH